MFELLLHHYDEFKQNKTENMTGLYCHLRYFFSKKHIDNKNLNKIFKNLIDINIQDKNGANLLMYHLEDTKTEKTNIIDIFINNGINLQHTDKNGNNTYFYSQKKHLEYLAKIGLNPFHKNKQNISMLEQLTLADKKIVQYTYENYYLKSTYTNKNKNKKARKIL